MRNPKKQLADFKRAMIKAAKFYGVEPHQICGEQYEFMAEPGALINSLRYIGKFQQIKNYFFPAPNGAEKQNEARACIERMLAYGKKAA